MAPRVSILIPTFNQRSYVEETVTSAVKQDYPNLQVVVADDASTDGTREILEALQRDYPDRLEVIQGKENLGITGNCNRALAHCDGDLVGLQGGDDVLLQGKVRAQAQWFEENAEGALCYHDCEVFDSDSGTTLCNFSALSSFPEGRGPNKIIRMMRLSAATTVMVRRDLIPDFGFDPRLPMVSDWKLQIDVLAQGGRFGAVAGVYARYRRHKKNSRKEYPVQYYQDCLCTLAIVESEMPGYESDTRIARSRIFGLMSVDHFLRGDRQSGVRLAAASARQGVFSWKYPLLVVYLMLPRQVQERIRKAFAGRLKALNYLNA